MTVQEIALRLTDRLDAIAPPPVHDERLNNRIDTLMYTLSEAGLANLDPAEVFRIHQVFLLAASTEDIDQFRL